MSLLIQEYLRNGGTIESLGAQYHIVAKRHGKFTNLVLFKYDQIESPFAEPIVRECRGIILDEANNWEVINLSMFKFFNQGEGHATTIDWSSARVQEKLDGSLCQLYSYDGRWHVATSGTPDAASNVGDLGFSFSTLFWSVIDGRPLPPPDCGMCFFFELMTPFNKVIVRHVKNRLALLGGRNLKTMTELSTTEAATFFPDFEVVREFPLQSFDDIVATFEHMSPITQEGYVVVDGNFNRVKCKSPAYVALHHLKDGMNSRRNLVEIVRSGEVSEVVSAFPEYAPMLTEIGMRLDELIVGLEEAYRTIADIPVQKDFALKATTSRCPPALFALRAKKTSNVRQFLRDLRIDSVVQLLGYRPDA